MDDACPVRDTPRCQPPVGFTVQVVPVSGDLELDVTNYASQFSTFVQGNVRISNADVTTVYKYSIMEMTVLPGNVISVILQYQSS